LKLTTTIARLSAGMLMSSAALSAQTAATPVAEAQTQPAVQAPAAQAGFPRVVLTAGRSTVVTTDFEISRIAITNPAIADATVVAPREILVDGKGAGTVSLIVWGLNRRLQYDVVVDPGVSALQQQFQSLFPGEDIQVTTTDEALTLSGHVSSNGIMLRAGELASATSGKYKVINLLQLPGGSESQQVMLQVRFAEVNRNAALQLGVNFFTGVGGFHNYLGRTTTEQFAAPNFQPGQLTFSDFLNLFLFNTNQNIGLVIKALQQHGFFQSLAEPNLIAYNGQEASFLAGGEFPVPVVQGATGTVTIQYKEFGVRLNFKPTIAGDMIRLKVRPEVSSLDFNNGVTLSGFRIPALTTRRAETDVELRDGQSFAIAGLLDNIAQTDQSAIPVLGSLPIIGNLFKSKADSAQRTELMVLITPRLVRALDPDEVPALPTLPGRFLKSGDEIGGEMQGGGGPVDAPPVKAPDKTKKPGGKQ
jgi:pilus assembly protein CpaC